MKYIIGEVVRVVNYDPMYNGHTGIVVSVDGAYHCVSMMMPTEDGNRRLLELYPSELRTEAEYWNDMYPHVDFRVKAKPLPEDLFKI